MEKNQEDRTQQIYKVTLAGSAVNLVLVLFKFTAGIIGCSAAMVADAVHSLSDLVTDIIVLVFVKISGRPADEDHHYGHGKYETLATFIVGISLLAVGVMLIADTVEKVTSVIHGNTLQSPGLIALIAAIVSIILKEAAYRFTAKVGKRLNSNAVIANAWHHRTDALSSIGTGLGIGASIVLGSEWAILDPLAAAIVSIFIIVAAAKLLLGAINELMEKSLPKAVEDRIISIVAEDSSLVEPHHLRTRSVGNVYSIEMHVRMPGETSLLEAHNHTLSLEKRLREEFGEGTLVNIHMEPIKVDGEYKRGSQESECSCR